MFEYFRKKKAVVEINKEKEIIKYNLIREFNDLFLLKHIL